MLGTDITSISRFRNVKESFVKKILHLEEIKEMKKIKNKSRFLAAHWAIKEALFKADNKLSSYSKIWIKKKDNKYKYKNFLISTSTEGNYYFAIVIKR